MLPCPAMFPLQVQYMNEAIHAYDVRNRNSCKFRLTGMELMLNTGQWVKLEVGHNSAEDDLTRDLFAT